MNKSFDFDLIGALAEVPDLEVVHMALGGCSESQLVSYEQFRKVMAEHVPAFTKLVTSESSEQGNAAGTSFASSRLLSTSAAMVNDWIKGGAAGAAPLAERPKMTILEIFAQIDSDGDGLVSWEDLYTLATDAAGSKLRPLPSDCVAPYAFSRSILRTDNITIARYLGGEANKVLVSSRHRPLELLDALTFRPVQTLLSRPQLRKLTENFLGASTGEASLLACAYSEQLNTLFAFFSDLRLHAWLLADANGRTHTYRPLPCRFRVSQMRAAPGYKAGRLFVGDRGGSLTVYEINKQHLDEPLAVDTFHLHDATAGGISNFCFITPLGQRIVSAGYDHSLVITDLVSRKSTVIGRDLPCATKFMEYSEASQSVVTVTVDNSITLWVTHQSARPFSELKDTSNPHLAPIVGLEVPQGSPRVVTTDRDGIVKVWDVRTFSCVQTFRADSKGGMGQGASATSYMVGASGGAGLSDTAIPESGNNHCKEEESQFVNATFYDVGSDELVCCTSRGLIGHAYGKGTDPALADDTSNTTAVRYCRSNHCFITMSASSLRIWDAMDLYLATVRMGTSAKALTYDGGERGRVPEKQTMQAAPDTNISTVGPVSLNESVSGIEALQSLAAANQLIDLTAFAIDRSGRRILVGYQNGDVEYQNFHGGTVLKRFAFHQQEVTRLLYSELHKSVVSTSRDGSLVVRCEGDHVDLKDPNASPTTHIQLTKADPITALAISSALGLIACGTKGGRVIMCDLRYPKQVIAEYKHITPTLPTGDPIAEVLFIGDFPLLASLHASGDVAFWSCRPLAVANANVSSPRHGSAVVSHGLIYRVGYNAMLVASRAPQAAGRASIFQEFEEDCASSPIAVEDALAGLHAVADAELNETQRLATQPPIPTCGVFDAKAHHLYLGDTAGYITVVPICPLLSALGLQTCQYPTHINHPPLRRLPLPPSVQLKVLATEQAHSSGEVYSLELSDVISVGLTVRGEPQCIPITENTSDQLEGGEYSPIVLSCGDDGRVCIWQLEGFKDNLEEQRCPILRMTATLNMITLPPWRRKGVIEQQKKRPALEREPSSSADQETHATATREGSVITTKPSPKWAPVEEVLAHSHRSNAVSATPRSSYITFGRALFDHGDAFKGLGSAAGSLREDNPLKLSTDPLLSGSASAKEDKAILSISNKMEGGPSGGAASFSVTNYTYSMMLNNSPRLPFIPVKCQHVLPSPTPGSPLIGPVNRPSSGLSLASATSYNTKAISNNAEPSAFNNAPFIIGSASTMLADLAARSAVHSIHRAVPRGAEGSLPFSPHGMRESISFLGRPRGDSYFNEDEDGADRAAGYVIRKELKCRHPVAPAGGGISVFTPGGSLPQHSSNVSSQVIPLEETPRRKEICPHPTLDTPFASVVGMAVIPKIPAPPTNKNRYGMVVRNDDHLSTLFTMSQTLKEKDKSLHLTSNTENSFQPSAQAPPEQLLTPLTERKLRAKYNPKNRVGSGGVRGGSRNEGHTPLGISSALTSLDSSRIPSACPSVPLASSPADTPIQTPKTSSKRTALADTELPPPSENNDKMLSQISLRSSLQHQQPQSPRAQVAGTESIRSLLPALDLTQSLSVLGTASASVSRPPTAPVAQPPSHKRVAPPITPRPLTQGGSAVTVGIHSCRQPRGTLDNQSGFNSAKLCRGWPGGEGGTRAKAHANVPETEATVLHSTLHDGMPVDRNALRASAYEQELKRCLRKPRASHLAGREGSAGGSTSAPKPPSESPRVKLFATAMRWSTDKL